LFSAIIIRDDGEEITKNYKRLALARKGVSSPLDLELVGLITRLGGQIKGGGDFFNVPPSSPVTISSNSLVLRLEPPPETIDISTVSDSQAEPILYSPLPASYSRVPGTRSITLTFTPDTIITPKVIGLTQKEWHSRINGRNWISDLITFLESLTIPLPGLGRKPWLALKHGSDVYGATRFGLQLEAVEVSDKWHGPNGIAQAEVRLRLREFVVI